MDRFFRLILIVLSIIIFTSTLAIAEEPTSPAGGQGILQTTPAQAEEVPPAPAEAPEAPSWDAKIAADTVWVLVTAFLVFFMNLGFGMVETGLCRAKNAVNILSKNIIVFCVTTVFFWLVGFAIMFGNGSSLFGTDGWLLYGADNSPATGDAYQGIFASLGWAGVPLYAKLG